MINLQMTKTSKTQKKNWQDIKICISAQTNDYNGCTVCLQMPCQSSTNQQLLPTRCNTCTHIQASCATLSGNWRLNCCWKIAKEKNLKSISLFRCNWSAANYLIASWQYSNFLKSLNANYLWLSSSARDNCRSYSVCAAFQIHQPEVKRISEQKQFFMQIVCLLASTLRYYIFFFCFTL